MARPTLQRNRKWPRLVRALGGQEALARGSLELLWDVAYENGDEHLGDSDDVELAARWQGEPGALAKALLEAGGPGEPGFIEADPDRPGRYVVHDLWDHAPDYVQRRAEREAARVAKGKTISDVRRDAAHARWKKQTAATDEHPAATGMQVTSNCNAACIDSPAKILTPAPTPAPTRAPTRASQPPKPPEAGGLAGDEEEDLGADLVLFRSMLAEELGLPQMLDIGGNRRDVLAFFRQQIAALGTPTILADCLAVAKKSTTGVPTSLAWFVGWLSKLPVPAGGAL